MKKQESLRVFNNKNERAEKSKEDQFLIMSLRNLNDARIILFSSNLPYGYLHA